MVGLSDSETRSIALNRSFDWRSLLPWAAVLIAVLTALGVFVAPWFVRVPIREVISDSQMLGFNNRVAVMALALGAALAGFLGLAWRFAIPERFGQCLPGALAERYASAEDRVDWRLAAGLMAVSALFFGGLAFLYGRYPGGDTAYFIDALLRLAGGGRFYQDFEFSYGPLLLFPTYWAWLAVRGIGLDLYAVYYTVAVGVHVLGIAMTVYLANRMRLSRAWRHGVVVLVFAFDLATANLGMNYTSMRFLAAFVLVVWALQSAHRGLMRGCVATAVAIVVAYAVSPEMGMAASVGLVVALCLWGAMRSRPMLLVGAVAAGFGAAGWLAYSLPRDSTFASFGQGAYQFPVLPGAPALLFVATLLLLGLAVGLTSDFSGGHEVFVQAGWFLTAWILIPVALGRADFGHVFWNGLGAILLTVAVLYQLPRQPVAAYYSAVFVVFVSCAFAYTTLSVPAKYAAGVRSGVIRAGSSMWVAKQISGAPETGRAWYKAAKQQEPAKRDLQMLLQSRRVAAPFLLHGATGALAQSGVLAPTYAPADTIITRSQFDGFKSGMDQAEFVLMPTASYNRFAKAAASRPASEADTMRVRDYETDPGAMATLEQFPLRTHATNPVFEPPPLIGHYLLREWAVLKASGDFTILRRK